MADSFIKEPSVDPTIGVAPTSLPREAILSTVPRSSLNATKKIVNVVPITANSIGPSQTIQFLLPQRNFAKANSIYLKFRFKATGGSAGQIPWAFSGGMQSAASLFNNLSIQAGGVILESMQNYHIWHNNIVEWMHSSNDLLKIESLCSGTKLPENFSVGGAIGFTTISPAPAAAVTLATGSYSSAMSPAGAAAQGIVPGMLLIGDGVTAGTTLVSGTIGGTLTFSASVTWGASKPYYLIPPALYVNQQTVGYNTDASNTTADFSAFYECGVQAATLAGNPYGNQQSLMQYGKSSVGSQNIDIVFSIPLYCGFFNPKESQLIPLEFINGGVLLTLQTNPITKAFWTESVPTSSSGFTSYTLQDFELCYTEIAPSPDFLMDVRADLMKQKFIKIETQSYQNFLLSAAQGNTRQMFNANLSSLSSLLFGRIVGADAMTTSKMFQWVGHDSNTTTRYEIYFDNVLMFNSANQLTDIAVVVRQLQEALGSSVSDYICTPPSSGRGVPVVAGSGNNNSQINYNTYCGGHALMGLSTRVFSSNSTSMDGTPVGTITINFYNNDGEVNTNLWYFYLVYDYIYTIDAMGSVEKVQ